MLVDEIKEKQYSQEFLGHTIDNFDLIKPLLKFENDDKDTFYFIQILQRKKENPLINRNANVIATYYIRSINHLEKLKKEIILLAKLYNARVYINLKAFFATSCAPYCRTLSGSH